MRVFRSVFSFLLFLLALLPGAGTVLAQDEPLRGFISVEPFEVRLEALVRVGPYREQWRITGGVVTSANRQMLLENFATLFESGVLLKAGGKPVSFTDRELRFVRPDPELGYIRDEREEIPLAEALVGITLSSGISGVNSLEGEWFWYPPGQERVTIEISSRGHPSARYVSGSAAAFSWKQSGLAPAPRLLEVPPPSIEQVRPLWFLTYIGPGLAILAIGTILVKKQTAPSWVGTAIVIALISAVLGFTVRVRQVETPDPETAEEITYRTLRNVYHAFDFRDESAIYDTLENSVSGSLLEKVYLEIQGSLQLESAGGPRVKVYDIALRKASLLDDAIPDSTMRVEANWATVGQVSHWGHTHERTNRYEAELAFVASSGRWKLEALALRNEERIQKVSRNPLFEESLGGGLEESDAAGESSTDSSDP